MAAQYDEEVRRKAVKLADMGVSVKAISLRLGACERTIRRWVKAAA